MKADWETAVVVDPRTLESLGKDCRRLRRGTRRLKGALCVTLAGAVVFGARLEASSRRLGETEQGLRECRKSFTRSSGVLSALARSQEKILLATERAPSVGTKSWGRRFRVTKYTPRSAAYGKFDDGLTATLTKADPKNRIVAVDPKLIPYGSWVWVEDLGWFHAEDCGAAIKGFRLDLLAATEQDAMGFGRQERFAIVVPTDA